MIHIVLLEPEIPQNTGNIARTCVATGAVLHLIEPLGFSVDDKALKRAGMDYWQHLTWHLYPDFETFLERNPNLKPAGHIGESGHPSQLFMATTKAFHTYTEVTYEDGCYIMFGKESKGIPEEILVRYPETAIRIPMVGAIRSLNLSNAVAIVLYEALRQLGFSDLKKDGDLHRLKWEKDGE